MSKPVLKQVWKGWRQWKWTREKLGWRIEPGMTRWWWQQCRTTQCFERMQIHATNHDASLFLCLRLKAVADCSGCDLLVCTLKVPENLDGCFFCVNILHRYHKSRMLPNLWKQLLLLTTDKYVLWFLNRISVFTNFLGLSCVTPSHHLGK